MYLLAQIWWFLLVAFLLGLLLGYIVWRACGLPRLQSLMRRDRLIIEDKVRALERENARLEEALAGALRLAKSAAAQVAVPATSPASTTTTAKPVSKAAAGPRRMPSHNMPPMPMPPNGNGASAGPLLASPKNGKADNLRLIRGVGPRLEKILNSMGVFHFEQIANWTEKDLAIVDGYLGDFAGRAVRDRWIDQSRKLAGLDEGPKPL